MSIGHNSRSTVDMNEEVLSEKGYWYVPRCRELRISKRISQEKLAGKADVARGTIGKIENNTGVSEMSARAVGQALEDIGHELNLNDEIFCLKTKTNSFDHAYLKKMKLKKDFRLVSK